MLPTSPPRRRNPQPPLPVLKENSFKHHINNYGDKMQIRNFDCSQENSGVDETTSRSKVDLQRDIHKRHLTAIRVRLNQMVSGFFFRQH